MPKSQKELSWELKHLKGIVKELHLDVSDGELVPSKLFQFPFRLSKEFTYNAHLMVRNPRNWIKQHGNKVKTIIFHPEPLRKNEIISLIKQIKNKKKKVGIALKPETKVKAIKDYLNLIDYVLILTVHPGFYGGKFISAPLKKIKEIKKINPHLKVIVDGEMNPKTIKLAKKAGGDYFVSGSYTTEAEKPKERIKSLIKAVKLSKYTKRN